MIDFWEFRILVCIGVAFGIVGTVMEHSVRAGVGYGIAAAVGSWLVVWLEDKAHR